MTSKKSKMIIAGAAALISLTSCGPAYFLGAQAATQFPCPEEQVKVDVLPGKTYRAKGCGKEDLYTYLGGIYFASLRTRAAFELSCAAEQLELTLLGGAVIGVSGCGKRATYIRADGWGWLPKRGQRKQKGTV